MKCSGNIYRTTFIDYLTARTGTSSRWNETFSYEKSSRSFKVESYKKYYLNASTLLGVLVLLDGPDRGIES